MNENNAKKLNLIKERIELAEEQKKLKDMLELQEKNLKEKQVYKRCNNFSKISKD